MENNDTYHNVNRLYSTAAILFLECLSRSYIQQQNNFSLFLLLKRTLLDTISSFGHCIFERYW